VLTAVDDVLDRVLADHVIVNTDSVSVLPACSVLPVDCPAPLDCGVPTASSRVAVFNNTPLAATLGSGLHFTRRLIHSALHRLYLPDEVRYDYYNYKIKTGHRVSAR